MLGRARAAVRCLHGCTVRHLPPHNALVRRTATPPRKRGRPALKPSFHGKKPGASEGLRSGIGKLVRQARQDRGLSQEQVGEPLVTATTVSLIERGKVLPGLRTLRQLATNLDVKLRELIPPDM